MWSRAYQGWAREQQLCGGTSDTSSPLRLPTQKLGGVTSDTRSPLRLGGGPGPHKAGQVENKWVVVQVALVTAETAKNYRLVVYKTAKISVSGDTRTKE